ncbi:transposable element Tcb2 transposase [Trichonephila clavipes]|nr:transposable element Tcb2 transposase [Trichonephila clavipes]
MTQRKHSEDFLRGRIIGRLECRRTQLKDQRNMESTRVSSPGFGNDSKMKGGAGWLVWGGIILGSRTDLHVPNVRKIGHIYWDVILEQHVLLFWGTMGAEFLFMDDNARPHRANIVDEYLQSEDITCMD